jgi:hypothetical protein
VNQINAVDSELDTDVQQFQNNLDNIVKGGAPSHHNSLRLRLSPPQEQNINRGAGNDDDVTTDVQHYLAKLDDYSQKGGMTRKEASAEATGGTYQQMYNQIINMTKSRLPPNVRGDKKSYIENNFDAFIDYLAYTYLKAVYSSANMASVSSVTNTYNKVRSAILSMPRDQLQDAVEKHKNINQRSVDASYGEDKKHYATPLLVNGIQDILAQLNEFINDVNAGVYSQPIQNPFGMAWLGMANGVTLPADVQKLRMEHGSHERMARGLKAQFERATETPFDLGMRDKLIKLYDHLIKLAEKKRDTKTSGTDEHKAINNRVTELNNIKNKFESKTSGTTDKTKLNQHVARLINYSHLGPKGYNNQNIPVTTTGVVKGGAEQSAIQKLDQFYNGLNDEKNAYTTALKNSVKSYERVFKDLQNL